LQNPSLLLLERQIAGLHVGGKSALAWYGISRCIYMDGPQWSTGLEHTI
jgi:hypothetical protein